MDTRDNDIRFLKRYAIGSTTLIVLMAITAFVRQPQKQKFREIDVERINIVEPDGKLRMVIANRPRSIGPIYKGKPFGYAGGNRPGIIFFNDEGTENGGLTLNGQRGADGKYTASTHMSFDQFDQKAPRRGGEDRSAAITLAAGSGWCRAGRAAGVHRSRPNQGVAAATLGS